jgi:hypothetical protein
LHFEFVDLLLQVLDDLAEPAATAANDEPKAGTGTEAEREETETEGRDLIGATRLPSSSIGTSCHAACGH